LTLLVVHLNGLYPVRSLKVHFKVRGTGVRDQI